jgi:integrase
MVAAFTGLRLGELLALRWRDIDWNLRLLHLQSRFSL